MNTDSDKIAAANRPLIAVAGASGFVGTHLRLHLAGEYRFRALTRSRNVASQPDHFSHTGWSHCDLFSLPRVTEALQGCKYGIYLVHSMEPSSRLMQGSFEDTDLLLADNFIRAAEAAGLEHVIYLSGLMPESGDLSPHLRSRREVEKVLQSRSVRVTVLRAGLIFGPGGSSFSMLVNLVRRLPVMLLPAWVGSQTHSIDIKNVCQAFEMVLADASYAGGTYDLAGHAPMTYREMILQTAALLKKPCRTLPLPLNLFSLSKQWVALFGGVSPALVGPLQESLQHDLIARPNPLLLSLKDKLIPFEASFERSIEADGRPKPNPRAETRPRDQQEIRRARRVRSVQRMPLPEGWDAGRVAREYSQWLSRVFAGLLKAESTTEGIVRFTTFGGKLSLLELTPTPYALNSRWRCAFYISGGKLSKPVDPPGRFEFRLFPENNCLIASIHGFSPTLPWWFYAQTQARIHLWVMKAFSRHLRRMAMEAVVGA